MSLRVRRVANLQSGLIERIRLQADLAPGHAIIHDLTPHEAKVIADQIYEHLEIPKIGSVDTSLPKRPRKMRR